MEAGLDSDTLESGELELSADDTGPPGDTEMGGVTMDDYQFGEGDAMDIDRTYLSDENEAGPVFGIDPIPRTTKGPESTSPTRATVEDEADEPADCDDTYVEAYPKPAGTPIGQGEGTFEAYRKYQVDNEEAPWAPFESEAEWELGRWLMTAGVSQNKINDFLKLNKVRDTLTIVK